MKKNLLITISGLLITLFSIVACSKSGSNSGSKPKISSITPNSVLTGANITVTGSNLSGASVTIANIAVTVTDNTSTSFKTIVPVGATAGVQPVKVTTSEGSATANITVTGAGAAPTITSFNPTSIKIGGTLTITGTGYENGASVEIATKLASVTAHTATTLTVTIPSGIALGAASIRVTTSLGTVVVGGLTIIP